MPRGGGTGLTLAEAVKALTRLHPPGPTLSDPFAIIIHETIAYLADDAARARAFATLEAEVGLSPKAIRAASRAKLTAICRIGGIHPELRAGRLVEIATLLMEECGGDLAAHLAGLSPAAQRKLLKRFPSIGDPGVDKILLASGLAPEPALESNGLRVLTRLGIAREEKSYAATYRNARTAILAEGKITRTWLLSLYQSARAHGQIVCRRTRPECGVCPLEAGCLHARTKA